jgi:hypothetical protein
VKTLEIELDAFAVERLRQQTLDVLTEGTGRASAETLRALDEGVERAVRVAGPRGLYKRSSVTAVSDTQVETADGTIRSPMFSKVARFAKGPAKVVFAIATVGGAFDEELAAEPSLLNKFVLDAVGSELAEIVADVLEEKWKNEMSVAGLEGSLRMSPGYCDWSLKGQDVVFTALDASSIGVRLTPSYLMIPAKSVSSAAVLAEAVPVMVACEICRKQACPFRRAEPPAAGECARMEAG